MKRLFILFIAITISTCAFSQGYNDTQAAMAMFVERMYNSEPFEGCRIIEDYDCNYLISIVALEKSKYKSTSSMNRVAQVKAQRNAGEFCNGTQGYSEFVVKTPQCKDNQAKDSMQLSEVFEVIKTKSTGYVKQLQLLTQFDSSDELKIYVFCTQIK